MKTIRIGLILALVATLALLALPGPAQAQGGFDITYNFLTSNGGWVGDTEANCDSGTVTVPWVSGHGWQNITKTGGGGCTYQRRVDISLSWPSGADVTEVKINFTSAVFDSGDLNDFIRAWSGSPAGSGSLTCDISHSAGGTLTSMDATGLSCSGSHSWLVEVDSGDVGDYGNTFYVSSIEFIGTGSSPITPTPTLTPTVSPTPSTGPLPITANYDPCPLMNDSNANLTDTSRWNLSAGAHQAIPNGIDFGTNTGGSPASTGYASQIVTLSRYNKYIVTLKYKQTTSASDQSFLFELGNTPALTVGLASGTAEQNVTFPAANYEPSDLGSADQYQILLASGSIDPGNDIIVTYVCIADENANNGGGTNPKAIATLCVACVYEPGTINGLGDIINNIVKLLQWLWCGISQIWDCSVRPFFATLLDIINIIISAIAFIRQWAGIIIGNWNGWIGAVIPILSHWVAGFLINVIQALLNAAATLAQSLGLGGLFDFILGLIRALPNIFNLIVSWVQLAIQQIFTVLSAIPTLFISLVNGFNHAAESTGATAPVCTDTSSPLYGPCLGLYVLDNTIFAGPMFYAVPLALGLIAFNTVLWAMQEIRGALTK